MLEEESAVGCYLAAPSLKLKTGQRKGMVILIEDLQKSRGYKPDTFFLAVNIADNFLSKRARENRPAPCLLTLAVTSVIIAAKIEEQNMPRILNMTDLLYEKHGVAISEETILSFEFTILSYLDFRLRYTSPVHFLERYQRIFGLDKEATDKTSRDVGNMARKFIRFMIINKGFLKYKPSAMAAASLLLGIKVTLSSGITKLTNEQRQRLIADNKIQDPDRLWQDSNEVVATGLDYGADIKQVYSRLVNKLSNTNSDITLEGEEQA